MITSTNSMMNTKSALGGITPPAPRDPYPSFDGMNTSHLSPRVQTRYDGDDDGDRDGDGDGDSFGMLAATNMIETIVHVPGRICLRVFVQPGMTWFKPNSRGCPREYELSNSFSFPEASGLAKIPCSDGDGDGDGNVPQYRDNAMEDTHFIMSLHTITIHWKGAFRVTRRQDSILLVSKSYSNGDGNGIYNDKRRLP